MISRPIRLGIRCHSVFVEGTWSEIFFFDEDLRVEGRNVAESNGDEVMETNVHVMLKDRLMSDRVKNGLKHVYQPTKIVIGFSSPVKN